MEQKGKEERGEGKRGAEKEKRGGGGGKGRKGKSVLHDFPGRQNCDRGKRKQGSQHIFLDSFFEYIFWRRNRPDEGDDDATFFVAKTWEKKKKAL